MFTPSGLCAFKVILVGNASTGKTSIIRRYCDDEFTDCHHPTIGADFMFRTLRTASGEVNLQICDTAGQERYHSLVPIYTRGASVAIVVFDLTNPASFHAIDSWVNLVQGSAGSGCQVIIAANKTDITATLPRTQIEEWSNNNSRKVMYVSARAGDGIALLFKTVVELLPSTADAKRAKPVDVDLADHGSKNPACC
jgi:small GTP-binding protein